MSRKDAARQTSLICRAVFLTLALWLVSPHAAAQRADAASGASKAAPCAACHGAPQALRLAGMPILAGQQQEFLVLQMFLMREGLRDVPQMAGMLKDFSDADLANV